MLKIALFFFTCIVLSANPSRVELQSIEKDAVQFGSGKTIVYVFIDPLCHNSQNYIELISTNKALQNDHTYYIFLQRLKKFNSDATINYIYEAKNPKKALLHIMMNNIKIKKDKQSERVKLKREKINAIALKTEMKRRPYLFIYWNGGSYCSVSEGEAPCMLKEEKP